MFVFDEELVYDWPVHVSVPKAGQFEKKTFTARFKALSSDRLSDLTKSVPEDTADLVMLREAVVGWSDVKDRDGEPLEFSQDALERMLQVVHVRRALGVAFQRSMAEIGRKN